MGCCGGRRAPRQDAGPRRDGSIHPPTGGEAPPPRNHAVHPRSAPTFIRYDGPTGMTVLGGGTGARYRFDAPGAVLPVDPRDRASLLAVPGLQQVASP